MAEQYYEGIGRRKNSSARVRLMKGDGQFTVNGKTLEAFFTREGDISLILSPLQATQLDRGSFNISVTVAGGGVTGQTEATRLGLARALLISDESYRTSLRGAGLLTRDARIKERKKPGLKRARKAPTYTKR